MQWDFAVDDVLERCRNGTPISSYISFMAAIISFTALLVAFNPGSLFIGMEVATIVPLAIIGIGVGDMRSNKDNDAAANAISWRRLYDQAQNELLQQESGSKTMEPSEQAVFTLRGERLSLTISRTN